MTEKVNEFVYNELGSILQDTREQKCFDLGYAYGVYWMYENLIHFLGKDEAEKCCRPMLYGTGRVNEYLRLIKSKDEEQSIEEDNK